MRLRFKYYLLLIKDQLEQKRHICYSVDTFSLNKKLYILLNKTQKYVLMRILRKSSSLTSVEIVFDFQLRSIAANREKDTIYIVQCTYTWDHIDKIFRIFISPLKLSFKQDNF